MDNSEALQDLYNAIEGDLALKQKRNEYSV